MNDDAPALIEMIKQALENCTDVDLLDLVYKLILSEVTT